MTEMNYVGNVLSKKGPKSDAEKVGAIQGILAPEDKVVLHRFSGLVQYLFKFIPKLSTCTSSTLMSTSQSHGLLMQVLRA